MRNIINLIHIKENISDNMIQMIIIQKKIILKILIITL